MSKHSQGWRAVNFPQQEANFSRAALIGALSVVGLFVGAHVVAGTAIGVLEYLLSLF